MIRERTKMYAPFYYLIRFLLESHTKSDVKRVSLLILCKIGQIHRIAESHQELTETSTDTKIHAHLHPLCCIVTAPHIILGEEIDSLRMSSMLILVLSQNVTTQINACIRIKVNTIAHRK